MRERAHSGTGLFMTELILVILFFSIAAACCLEAFAASSRLHERARRLEQAFGYIHIVPQIFDKIKDIFLIIFDNIRLFRQNNRKNRA